MGLQTNYTGPDGVAHPECYLKIILTQNDYLGQETRVTVGRYHDKVARDAKKRAEYIAFTLLLDPKEFDAGKARELVYRALKALPEFTEAIDILEVA